MLVSIQVGDNPDEWFSLEDQRIVGPLTEFLLGNVVLVCDNEVQYFFEKLLTPGLAEYKRNYLVELINNAFITNNPNNIKLDFALKNDVANSHILFEDLWKKSLGILKTRTVFDIGLSSELLFQSSISKLAALATKAKVYDKYAYVLIAPEKSMIDKYKEKQIDLEKDNAVDWLLAFPDLELEFHTLASYADKEFSESGEPIKTSFRKQSKKLSTSLERKIRESGRSSFVNTTLFTYEKYTEAHHDRWIIFEIGGKDLAVQLPAGLADFLAPALPAPKNFSFSRDQALIRGIKTAWESRILLEKSEPGKSREAIVLTYRWSGELQQPIE